MSHANAALTPIARRRLAELVVDHGWSVSQAAEYYRVSWPTAKRWSQRYRDQLEAGVTRPVLTDRSSRPHHSPNRTPAPVVRKIVQLRWKKRLGPVPIGGKLGMPASTVHAVLTRCRVHRLSHIDRRTGEPIRRYEHPYPGSMVHVDVKKLGNIPDGGGWRFVGRKQGFRNRANTLSKERKAAGPRARGEFTTDRNQGHAYVHSVIDDHSRVVYSEVHDDELAETATLVLRNAHAWFLTRGVRIESVLSDNGACYKSLHWKAECRHLEITPRWIRPRRPQTNGKIERFHRTLADGWAYSRLYGSEHARRAALPTWIHHYNHHRPHTATSNRPPITRLTNVPGQYN